MAKLENFFIGEIPTEDSLKCEGAFDIGGDSLVSGFRDPRVSKQFLRRKIVEDRVVRGTWPA
jgi:hypothetical protein